jgi:hypothetical protein
MQKSFASVVSVIAAAVMLLGNVRAQQSPAAATQPSPAADGQNVPALKTQKDKVSYAIGMNIGTTLHRQSIDVDPNIVRQGLEDAMGGGKTVLSEEEVRAHRAPKRYSQKAAGENAASRGNQQKAGRRIPGREQGQGGRGHVA